MLFDKNWLKQFPTWKALSKASNADVIHVWSGLGYNRRALALRDIAKQVIENGIPETREQWIELKGIGPYTSAAISLFSNGEKVFPVDSIIRRFGGRYYFGRLFPTNKVDERLEKKGLELLNQTDRYQDIPQALFDLGTKVCKKNPDCKKCPLKSSCKAAPTFLSGKVIIPKRSLPKAKEKVHAGKKFPDRIYRGRILGVVKQGGLIGAGKRVIIKLVDQSYTTKLDKEWFHAMLARLEKDELIVNKKNKYYLKTD